MTTSVGVAYRRQIFAWIEAEQERLFAAESAAAVAVYYSPATRDYVDQAAGSGLFATLRRNDPLWWANERSDSVYALTYLAEYRGITKWLLHNHIPFDIVVAPDAAELARYRTVLAPGLAAISDTEAELLDGYVAKGGHLITTGPTSGPAMLDGLGNARTSAGLRSLVAGKLSALSPQTSSAGTATHIPQPVGTSYLTSDPEAADRLMVESIGRFLHSPISTNAGTNVHMELRAHGSEMLLHLVNPERLWDRNAPKQRHVDVRLALPPNVGVTSVQLKSPLPPEPRTARRMAAEPKSVQRQAGAVSRELSYRVDAGRVSFTVPLQAYALVVISTAPE
jgi:hypothetical protein